MRRLRRARPCAPRAYHAHAQQRRQPARVGVSQLQDANASATVVAAEERRRRCPGGRERGGGTENRGVSVHARACCHCARVGSGSKAETGSRQAGCNARATSTASVAPTHPLVLLCCLCDCFHARLAQVLGDKLVVQPLDGVALISRACTRQRTESKTHTVSC